MSRLSPKKFVNRYGVVGELFAFLWQNKRWWLIPMTLLLIIFGILFVFASSSVIAPFIYTFF